MSMVEKLKKNRLIKYLYIKKSKNIIFTDIPNKKLTLSKSNSSNIKTEINKKNNNIPLLALKPASINKEQKKLRYKNIQLQSNLNKMKKDLILAKSTEHKKLFELKKKEKLLNNAINIKKLAIETEQDNFLSSYSNIYQMEREKEIIEESFKSNLLYKIKRQYNILEKDNNNKISEIIKLKNNIKHCKNKELIAKNKKLLIDLIEIKGSYDKNIIKNNEYKLKIRDYIELEEKLTRKNFIILNLQESLKEVTNSNLNIENQIEELKFKLKELEIDNQNLNNQFDILNENCNQVLINKKEIENKYAILLDEEKEKNENNISNLNTD
jgi:hypothetical protein